MLHLDLNLYSRNEMLIVKKKFKGKVYVYDKEMKIPVEKTYNLHWNRNVLVYKFEFLNEYLLLNYGFLFSENISFINFTLWWAKL